MFNVCYICRCQRFQISLGLYFFPTLDFELLQAFLRESTVSWSPFSCNSLLLCWSPVGEVVNCGKRGVFYIVFRLNLSLPGGPVSGLWPSQLFLRPVGETGKLEGAAVRECPSPSWDKAGQSFPWGMGLRYGEGSGGLLLLLLLLL